MEYLSAAKTAENGTFQSGSVRNYCAEGRVPGVFLTGKTWNIPADAEKPERAKRKDTAPAMLLDILKEERSAKRGGRNLPKVQIALTYNSNHMEDSRLTHNQTRYIYETNTIGFTGESVNADDLIDFHVRFERIHPFQDGSGRVRRLNLFKECLKYGIVPFIIEDDLKLFYYRGLKEWGHENGDPTHTFLTAQDWFKKYLDYFRMPCPSRRGRPKPTVPWSSSPWWDCIRSTRLSQGFRFPKPRQAWLTWRMRFCICPKREQCD